MADPKGIDTITPVEEADEDTYILGVKVPAVGPREAVLVPAGSLGGTGGGTWGSIGGTLADQADLAAALTDKATTSHSHTAATTVAPGFMAAADKAKLDNIEPAAQVNRTPAGLVDAIDQVLGGEGWRANALGGLFTLVAMVTASADGTPIAVQSSGYVPFDSVVHPASSPPVTVSGGEITLNIIGSFLVLALTGAKFTTGNVKGYAPVTLQSDVSGTFATVAPGIGVLATSGGSANQNHQNAHESVMGLLTVAETGKKLRVKLETPDASTSALTTQANRCLMAIFQLGASGGAGGGSLTFYDEAAALGAASALKFTGAGVTAALNGETVEVTIPATALVAGSDRQVQFNDGGSTAGAAGVNVRSPANTRSLANHILQASNYEFDVTITDVVAGGTASPNPANAAEQRFVLTGTTTMSAAEMGGADLANGRMRLVNCTLYNATAQTITVNTPTGAAASGLWTRAWGSDGVSATSFAMAAYSRRECGAVVYRDANGVLYTEWRG